MKTLIFHRNISLTILLLASHICFAQSSQVPQPFIITNKVANVTPMITFAFPSPTNRKVGQWTQLAEVQIQNVLPGQNIITISSNGAYCDNKAIFDPVPANNIKIYPITLSCRSGTPGTFSIDITACGPGVTCKTASSVLNISF